MNGLETGPDGPLRVAVVGGGISGLAVAHALRRRAQAAGRSLALRLYAARSGMPTGASSHGDVIPAMVATALGRGARLDGPASAAKGGRSVLGVADGAVACVSYVPPTDRTDRTDRTD